MNITFLVGNGFDLGLGLHTSYCDFYKWYCSQDDASEYIQRFKKNIEDDLTNGSKFWSDFEIGLGEYSNSFSAETYNQYIACIEDARRKLVEYLVSA